MDNVVNSPKTLARLWAALSCDFETLLARFMGSKGRRYVNFAEICRQQQITLIMHITQGHGKSKDEHYLRITDMILQMCKDLWLRSSNANSDQNKSSAETSMELKRSLGGFYLLYTMYEKQPLPNKVKIALGIEDMVAFNKFSRQIKELPFGDEVTFMLLWLEYKQAFHYGIFSEDYRFDASTRNFLNISGSEVVQLTKRMRGTQDVLAYSDVHDRVEKSFELLTKAKNILANALLKTSNPQDLEKHWNNQSVFNMFVHTVNSENLRKSMKSLDDLLDEPVMTLEGLTATEAIDHRIMMETQIKMERARKKAQSTEREGEQKAVRSYVREGGIFGRKKEVEESDDKIKRRDRGSCNGNLWTYIKGLDSYKPFDNLQEQPNEKPPSQSQMEMEDDPLTEFANMYAPSEPMQMDENNGNGEHLD